MSRPRLDPLVAALAALLPVGALLACSAAGNPVWMGMDAHFTIVGGAALIAFIAALALSAAGAKARDARVVVTGTAFAVMGALLSVHGLVTPDGPVMDIYAEGLAQVTAGMALPFGALLLALAASPALRRVGDVRRLIFAEIALIALIAVVAAVGVARPELIPELPRPGDPLALINLFVGTLLFVLLALRALRTYRLTQRRGDLSVLVGFVWLAAALAAMMTTAPWSLAWWVSHALELGGIALIGIPSALDLRRAQGSSRPLLGDLRAIEIVTREEAYLGSTVRSLLVQLAAKDGSTEEHTRRVALRAVEIGEELGLDPGRLRTLAIGGLLHDVGKLSVPDAVLKKPGSLSDEEYAVIKRHPEWGQDLLAALGGFSTDVQRLVSDHHERLDGRGYPHGLTATQLPLDTRILSVADVYDALVSPRVYRQAWSRDEAVELLASDTGTAFDGSVVAALGRVLEREDRLRAAADSERVTAA